jgi:hypothetical protein
VQAFVRKFPLAHRAPAQGRPNPSLFSQAATAAPLIWEPPSRHGFTPGLWPVLPNTYTRSTLWVEKKSAPEPSTSLRKPHLCEFPQALSAQPPPTPFPVQTPPRRCLDNHGAVAAAGGAGLPASDVPKLDYKRRRLRRAGRNFPERSV